ncbi:MAG: hypothetical protein ABI839_03780 [Verrucomicrobiota bacterium]
MTKAALATALLLSMVCLPSGRIHATELFEDVIEKTVALEGASTFSLTAVDGVVQIYGSSNADVKITATRKAFSLARLNAMQIRVEATPGALHCMTTSAPQPKGGWRDTSGTVDYVVELPQNIRFVSVAVPNGELVINGLRGSEVTATLGNGRATMRNCFCNQNLRVGSGGFDLIFDWAEPLALVIDASISNGNARALISADAAFHVQAHALSGHVASDFTEMKERKTRVGGGELDQHFGTGPESTVKLRADRGNIRLTEVVW